MAHPFGCEKRRNGLKPKKIKWFKIKLRNGSVFTCEIQFQFHVILKMFFKRTFVLDIIHGWIPHQNQAHILSAFRCPSSDRQPLSSYQHGQGYLKWWKAAFLFLEAYWPLCASENARSEEHTSELQSRGHLVCR